MANPSRRFIAGLIRFGLVALAILLVAGWVKRRVTRRHAIPMATAPSPDVLAPGDLRIYNADSTIDLVLKGDRILAGLSPTTVEKIKAKLDTSASRDSSGLGASISSVVKRSVAGAIGTHAAFPLNEVEVIRYEDGAIKFESADGTQRSLFQNMNINGKDAAKSFRAEDVEAFIAAVQARKAELARGAIPVPPVPPAPGKAPH